LWLQTVTAGNPFEPATSEQAAAVYAELRRIAAAYMGRERRAQSMQATALVHEAWIRLAGAQASFHDESHFIGIAARSMRQVLVDRARARGAQKRWAGLDRVSLSEALVHAPADDGMLPALDDALTRLEQLDPEQTRIIDLRYFAGLSIEETAAALGLSPATVKRRFAMARAWLLRDLESGR
jgi:RNA polymerase sigma factor (TIGR02999 family)